MAGRLHMGAAIPGSNSRFQAVLNGLGDITSFSIMLSQTLRLLLHQRRKPGFHDLCNSLMKPPALRRVSSSMQSLLKEGMLEDVTAGRVLAFHVENAG